jgi:hypothetical protein
MSVLTCTKSGKKSWPNRGDRNHDGLAAALIFCSPSQRDKGEASRSSVARPYNRDRRLASLEGELLVRSTKILPWSR